MRVTAKMLRDAGWVRIPAYNAQAVGMKTMVWLFYWQDETGQWLTDSLSHTFHEAAAIFKQQMKENENGKV